VGSQTPIPNKEIAPLGQWPYKEPLIQIAMLWISVVQAAPFESFQSCMGNKASPDRFITQSSPPNIYKWHATGFSKRIVRKPAGIFFIRTEQDVQQAVQCCIKVGLKAVPRGGGHNYESLSSGDGVIVLDLAELHAISIDAASETATVGGGARLGNVYYQAYNQAKLDFNAGTCKTVGIGGHVSGGGFGMSSRYRGLASDQVLSMRVVTADGKVALASPTSNTDLYWALRGGGQGSFGVVTQYTLKLYKSPTNTFGMFSFKFPTTSAEKIISAFANFFPDADPRLSAFLILSRGTVEIQGQYIGTSAERDALLQKSGLLNFAANSKVTESCTALGARAFFANGGRAGDCAKTESVAEPGSGHLLESDQDYSKKKQAFFTTLSAEAIHYVVDQIVNVAPQGTWLMMDAFGGEISKKTNTDTPFNCRECKIGFQYAIATKEAEAFNSPKYEWQKKFADGLDKYSTGKHYTNYPDLDYGANFGVYYWGSDNFERLKQIKKKYDPSNLFQNGQSIPLPGQ
jgi:FAD/FMN-containing dehydrogenase